MKSHHLYLGLVLLLTGGFFIFLNWPDGDDPTNDIARLYSKIEALETELNLLEKRLDSEILAAELGEGMTGEIGVEQAMKLLGSSDPIAQYRGGRMLRSYGDEAVEPLAETIRRGENTTGAAVVLTSLSGDKALNAIRELTQELLHRGDERAVAVLLGELARRRDHHSAALFRQALQADADAVQLTAVSGVRRLSDCESLGKLIGLYHEAGQLLRRELHRTIHGLAASDPDEFERVVVELEPEARFEIVKLMLAQPGRSQRRILRTLADKDPDPRVVAGANRALELIRQRDEKTAYHATEEPLEPRDVDALSDLLDRIQR